jgi:TetR/AcrR family transcriptional repressor of nem operon
MARPREFNVDQALEQAMQVFWTKGYEATSLRDLIDAMGISKSSFYDTFGCKHELFLAAIDRYNETVTGCSVKALIAKSGSPKQGIADFFACLIEGLVNNGGKRGCFVGNCAVEVARHDTSAARRVAEGLANMERAFFETVKDAQSQGEIPSERDARAMARYLTGTLNGLLVMGKAKPDRETLEDVARIALTALD